ncbi:LmeA family phospholipid-binding protein [Modestobacter lapidis]|nr:DUF2993 domain-containing protein [Modestobacter lapidis]
MTDQAEQPDGREPSRREDPAPLPRRRPASGTVALAITVVLGTALLLWGADWLARWGAQSLLARTIQESTGVAARPVVQVHGTVFLTQVVRGRYDDVEVIIRGVSSGPLRIEEVHARLSGVHVPFRDVLVQDPGPVLVERSSAEAVLTYADLDRYLLVTGRPLTLDAAPDGEVLITGTVQVLGRSVSASTRAQLSARDGALAVRPTGLDTDTALDPASRLLLGQRFTFLVPLDPLPFGHVVIAVQPRDDALHLRTAGTDVVIRR